MTQSSRDFQNPNQSAIFNFLIQMILEYKKTMSSDQAVDKACDWLISLASQVRTTSNNILEEDASKQATILNDMTDTQNTDTKDTGYGKA